MAPKRLAASSSPSPKAKKPKLTIGQTSLHNFFRSPSKSAEEPDNQESAAEIQDRDLAEQLARKEGIDVETTRRLEASWRDARASRSGSDAIDPIEVDTDQVSSGLAVGTASVSEITPKKSTTHSRGHVASGSKPAQRFMSTVSHSINVTLRASAPSQYPDLSIDPITFVIDGNSPWYPLTQAPYSFLVHALSTLSHTRSRILILNTLTNYLRLVSLYDPTSLLPSLYLLSNTVAPPYLSVELGLGPSIISKAIQQVSGLTSAALNKLYRSLGDPGDVAFTAKSSVRTLIPHPALSVQGVYDTLLQISRAQGQGAAKTKHSLVEKLLLSAKGEESRYLVRTLCQNLRVGAVRNTIISALARAVVFSPPEPSASKASKLYASPELLEKVQPIITEGKKKSLVDPIRQEIVEMFANAEALVKRCFVQHPNLDNITAALLEVGLEGLVERVPLAVGVPLHPTLGSPTRSLDEVYERLNEQPFAAEFKYDGQRAQLHASRGNAGVLTVKIFSRHLEDMTDKYPDVIALTEHLFASRADLSSFIVDAEIVAVDVETGGLKSFQDLSQRARKDVRLEDVKVAVCIFVYDLMYLNGKVLLEMPFRQRRNQLRENFPPMTPKNPTIARLDHVESCDSEEGRDAIEEFWEKAVAGRSEGLMIKLLDNGEVSGSEPLTKNGKNRKKPLPASYEPDKRTLAWLKLKKDYVTGLGDSLDLVPIGSVIFCALKGTASKGHHIMVSKVHGMDTDGRLIGGVPYYSHYGMTALENLSLFANACLGFLMCSIRYGRGVLHSTSSVRSNSQDLKERYPPNSNTCSSTPLWNCKLGSFNPSVYFKPSEVWEVRGADITLSPVSLAALGFVPGKRGLSLRFPRFIKIREDKGLEEASTPKFLADMWQVQEQRGREGKGKGKDEGELLDVEWESEAVEDSA